MEDVLTLAGVMLAIGSPFLIGGIIREYFKYKREIKLQLTDLNKEMSELDIDALKQEIKAQRQRIEVLEAIVTDRQYELNAKIEAISK